MFAEPLSASVKRRLAAHAPKTIGLTKSLICSNALRSYEKITLVCDNLNTHTKGAFYEAFAPPRARDYVQRINFCYTPKHGSWLNVPNAN